jgi:hypothetical protein
MAFMTIWSIVVDAPLEEPANPTKTPNPSKAPWYFLGLQEILVYFDPWFAGVILPGAHHRRADGHPVHRHQPEGERLLLLQGSRVRDLDLPLRLPGHVDRAHHHGHVHPRPGLVPVPPRPVLGRPQDCRDHQRQDLARVLRPDAGTSRSTRIGIGSVGFWLVGLPAIYWKARSKKSETLQKLGAIRYWITAFLFMTMMGTVVKVVLRLALSIKYIWMGPYNFNI